MQPQHSDRFLMDYFPRPPDGGSRLLRYARRPPRAPACSVPLAAPQRNRHPGAGSGTQGALCLAHGALSCARCSSLGWGISRCCRSGHVGHRGSLGGLSCPVAPPRVAPGRQVLVPEAQRAGAAALSSRLGRASPASHALPDLGPPPRVLGMRPSLARGPDAPRPANHQAPNRANRGVPGGLSHQAVGGGATDPLLPQPTGRGNSPRPTPRLSPPARRPWGRCRAGGQRAPPNPAHQRGAQLRVCPPPPHPPPERGAQ